MRQTAKLVRLKVISKALTADVVAIERVLGRSLLVLQSG